MSQLVPSDHQRKFLYLPLSTLADFTNARSIIIKYDGRKDGKPLKEIEIKHKMKKLHRQMAKLDKWTDLHLDELRFISSMDAHIWTLPEKVRSKIHEKLSDHQKQFTYLPLDVLKRATNIGELVLPTIAKGRKSVLDYAIGEIHKQMPTSRWFPELANLRFVESIKDDESATNENLPIQTIHMDSESEAEPSTSANNASNAKQQSSVDVPQSRNSDLSTSKRDESANDKSKSDATPPVGNMNGTSTKSSTPITTENRRITRRISVLNAIDQTPQSSSRSLRKRKSDSNATENQSPKKKPNTPVRQRRISTPKPASGSKLVPDRPTRPLTQQNNDLSRNDAVPSKKSENNSADQHQTGIVQSVECTNPNRQMIEDPPAPVTTSETTDTLDVDVTSATTQKDVENGNNEINEAVIESCSSNIVAETEATIYDQLEDELIRLGEGSECNGDERGTHHDVYSPSDFQREILELSFDDFIANTNIKDLVLKEHRKMWNDENAIPTTADMRQKLQFYYDFSKRTHEWHKNSMKNLSFKQPERNAANSLLENPHGKGQAMELNDFQREIMALSYEAFINETNVRDIVSQDFHNQFKGTKAMAESDMENGLKHYEKLRDQPTKWHKSSMNHLKFKQCECKRKKQFKDASVAMDVIETSEIGCMVSFDSDEISEANQQQLELAALTVHTVPKSRTICITTNLSSEASEPYREQETNAGEHQEDNDDGPTEPQNTTAPALQMPSQSEDETHCSSSQSVATPGSAPLPNEVRLDTNPLETEAVPRNAPAAAAAAAQVSINQRNSPPISASSNSLNETADAPSQKEFVTSSSGSTLVLNVKTEPDYHLGDDDDVICLGDMAVDIIDVSSEDSDDGEDSSLHENLTPLKKRQPSPTQNANEFLARDQLVNILSDNLPAIEDSESPQNNSPLRNHVNIQPSEDQLFKKPLSPAPKKRTTLSPRSNTKEC